MSVPGVTYVMEILANYDRDVYVSEIFQYLEEVTFREKYLSWKVLNENCENRTESLKNTITTILLHWVQINITVLNLWPILLILLGQKKFLEQTRWRD